MALGRALSLCLFALLVALPASGGNFGGRFTAVLPNTTGGLGVNLSRPYYYETGLPWVNALKKGRPWRTCDDTSNWSGSSDANGYPLSGQPCAETHLFAGAFSDSKWPLGEYTVLYDGTVTLAVSGTASNLQTPSAGRATFDVGTTPSGSIEIEATSGGFSNMRVYPPGGACAASTTPPHQPDPFSFCSTPTCPSGTCSGADACGGIRPHCVALETLAEAGELEFYPPWVRQIRWARIIRFMDWMHANWNKIDDGSTWRPVSRWSWSTARAGRSGSRSRRSRTSAIC